MSDTRIAINLNLRTGALTQFTGYDFNTLADFNGVPLAGSSAGIFTLDTADDDNGTNVDAVMEFATSDLGTLAGKRFRRMYVGYETSGSILIKLVADDESTHTFLMTPGKGGNKQHRQKVPTTRNTRGVYWKLRIENKQGADFSLDNITALINHLGINR